ncbi:MAG: hypothetical protein UV71_C0003G0034 [Microgenomates group bacterium GW2011_GWC1_43_13]|uniref:Uncharacterized protein n=3 Tax=Candidatus Woeseibacteriota TaxID=1752722 RepID=A0A837IA59_9BACT|nr:MAG: hypothetical protein UV71_C0003G0034 [Microgenomates group bacterium GW2011_GWC1_43_13]KKT33416.1 MAG: hypothetical protein UW20_C0002G0007 [Candidatus Woesebacteria bacterium GW2011_GWB1_44_11]KKT54841.1 MAG: hypothetical protein UW47_C0002G0025 [Candidatus Woesebacteria bacterium GW2011_GWA1_44_23]OGM76002.1 MAG: hypothetical protein A2208_02905 [Candidatus Woesebacteria bacterium RIFOXYA1_FULL_43_16]OGM81960.1 MAG: hypothetical protein A2394_03070 [Candidatus Woesebacteria bacterium 
MCPVCTVTVIAGLGISRLLGIDDLITAIWIGGLILSLSFITIDWIKKKWPKLKLKYYYFPTFILMYLFVFIPFKLNGTIGIVRNTMWGVDKIILGIIIGSAALLLGVLTDKYQRVKFKKIFFPFQKVFFPVLALIITSLIFYLITAG